MRVKLGAMKRLASLYLLMEEAQQLALEQAAGALHQVERGIERQQALNVQATMAGTVALIAGNRDEHLMLQSQRGLMEQTVECLDEIRHSRQERVEDEAEVYRERRMERERVEHLLEALGAELDLERRRGEQRVADDRYLSRQRWQAARESRPAPGE
jgi:hypothetical protein